MANFNYSINAESAVKEYDNQGAYNTLQEMMKRKEQLTVKFYGGKDNIPCAWIESAHVAGFKYQLKSASYQGLLDYLFKGKEKDNPICPVVQRTSRLYQCDSSLLQRKDNVQDQTDRGNFELFT